MTRPSLALISMSAALTGGLLWSVKSLSILIADYQPDYTFEVAVACFGVATLGVASKVTPRGGAARRVATLAMVAALAGLASALTYVVAGDNDAFGLLTMVAALSTLAVLLYGGHKVKVWSVLPFYLGCLYVLGLPVGGALSAIDERLLELPLLAVAVGWIALAGRMATDTRLGRLLVESPASAG